MIEELMENVSGLPLGELRRDKPSATLDPRARRPRARKDAQDAVHVKREGEAAAQTRVPRTLGRKNKSRDAA